MKQAIFKRQSQQPGSHQNSRLSVDAGPFMFHYLTEDGVCYLCLADKGYPKKLAYQYLEELQREFSRLYGPQINTATRPYAFIKFGAHSCLTCMPGKHAEASCSMGEQQLVHAHECQTDL